MHHTGTASSSGGVEGSIDTVELSQRIASRLGRGEGGQGGQGGDFLRAVWQGIRLQSYVSPWIQQIVNMKWKVDLGAKGSWAPSSTYRLLRVGIVE